MTREELCSLAKGAGLAAGGALVAFTAETLIPALQSSGSVTALAIAAFASVALNAIRKKFFPTL